MPICTIGRCRTSRRGAEGGLPAGENFAIILGGNLKNRVLPGGPARRAQRAAPPKGRGADPQGRAAGPPNRHPPQS